MANAQTEHSKKLRASTAAARNKRLREEGKVRQVCALLPTETADELDAIGKELGLSRPKLLAYFCELHRKQTP